MTNPSSPRLYRTYTAVGTRLDGTMEKISFMETDLPETMLIYIGEDPKSGVGVVISRGTWNLIQNKMTPFAQDFTWVEKETLDPDSSV